jgi:hypothetical protein
MTRDLGTYRFCGFSSFMSISQVKCPLDVQLDMKVRIRDLAGGAAQRKPTSTAAAVAAVSRSAALLAEPAPPLAWVLLRDARSLMNAAQYRRAVIDAATASDLAVTQLLDTELQIKNPTDRTQILAKNMMLGQKLVQLTKLGSPLPQSFNDKLVSKRNVAVHEGAVIGKKDCSPAIREAVLVVEEAFPLPAPPGGGAAFIRLW